VDGRRVRAVNFKWFRWWRADAPDPEAADDGSGENAYETEK
jgi:hypothetical protein